MEFLQAKADEPALAVLDFDSILRIRRQGCQRKLASVVLYNTQILLEHAGSGLIDNIVPTSPVV